MQYCSCTRNVEPYYCELRERKFCCGNEVQAWQDRLWEAVFCSRKTSRQGSRFGDFCLVGALTNQAVPTSRRLSAVVCRGKRVVGLGDGVSEGTSEPWTPWITDVGRNLRGNLPSPKQPWARSSHRIRKPTGLSCKSRCGFSGCEESIGGFSWNDGNGAKGRGPTRLSTQVKSEL